MICSLPGFHVTVNAYLCRASIIACILLGAARQLLIHGRFQWTMVYVNSDIRVAKDVLVELVHGEYDR